MSAWEPPRTFDGLNLLRPLGRGGMGAVYLAHDVALDRPTALKVIRAEEPTPELRARFLTEARALARLQHVNVVNVYRFGEVEGRPYLAYEFVEGGPIDAAAGPVPWTRALSLAVGLARGMAAAHERGVLHRDIKPANVLVTPDGVVKLLDFGLAQLADRAGHDLEPGRATLAGRVAGTPAWIAPERWFGGMPTPAADVWAFGMVVRQLLTGRHALDGLSVGELARRITQGDLPSIRVEVPDVPAVFAALVDRCVAVHEARRPRDGVEVREAIEAIRGLINPFGGEPGADPNEMLTRVTASFGRMLPHADRLGERFYARLFERHPELRGLFPASMEMQRDKLVGALQLAVQHLRNPDVLVPMLRDLGRRHAAYGTHRAHFGAVGEALLDVLAELDADGWSPAVAAAWGEAWDRIARTMLMGLAEGRGAETIAGLSTQGTGGVPLADTVVLPAAQAPVPPPSGSPPSASGSSPSASPPSAPGSPPQAPGSPPQAPPPGSSSATSRGSFGTDPPGPDTSALPAPLTRFFGRDDEIATIARLVGGGARLVTLLGMGGVGKTRLGLEAARRLLDRRSFARVAWVPLADARGRDAGIQAMLRGLAVKDAVGDPLDALVAATATGRTLLVLDNLEHLVDALADDLLHLLERSPGICCLVTSQRALEVVGESLVRLLPLPLPEADGDLTTLEANAAVRLFLDRARLARPSFALDASTAPLVVQLVRRLDGLPLAVEFVAARAGQTDLASLRARLDADPAALGDRGRNRPDRQRSLEAAMRWTVDLLSPARRALFARLSVFPGEFDVGDVRAVVGEAGGDDGGEDALTDLALCSLLVPVDDAPGRFRALSVVRAFAATLLDPGEAAALTERFRQHFLEVALAWVRALGTPDATGLATRLDRAWPSVMAAVDLSPREEAANILGRTPVHVLWTGRFAEMLPRFDPYDDPAVLDGLTPATRAALVRAGHRLSLVGGDARRAVAWRAHVRRCLAQEEIPPAGRVGLESELIVAAIDRGALSEAEEIASRHLAHETAQGNRRSIAVNLDSLARIAFFGGDLSGARARSAAAWEHAQEVGDPQLRDVCLGLRLTVEMADERVEEALELLGRLEAERRALGRPPDDAVTDSVRITLALLEGQVEDAWRRAVVAERAARGHGRLRVYGVDQLARVAFARGDHARALVEARRAQAGFAALLRPVELPRPMILVARALGRRGEPGAVAALVEAARATLAVEGWRHAPGLIEAWRELAPGGEWPVPGRDGAWRRAVEAALPGIEGRSHPPSS